MTARAERASQSLAREPLRLARAKPVIFLHSHDTLDHTITLSIDGTRWEYYLTPQQCDTAEYLCRKISARKALAFCRARSTRQVKL